MFDFYLPQGKREELEEALSQIENELLKSDDLSFDPPAFLKYNIKKILSIIREDTPPQMFKPTLDKLLKKLEELVTHVKAQKQITEFYEEGIPSTSYFSSSLIALLGPPQYPQLKVFTRENDDFYIQTLKFPKLKAVQDIKTGAGSVDATCNIAIGETERWNNNYRELTDRILKEGKDYSKMLMKTLPEIPHSLSCRVITTCFIQEFLEYEKP